MPAFASLTQRIVLICILVCAALAANGYWIIQGRTEKVVDAPARRIACVSYAPYRKPGETPFDPLQIVSEERIEQDLSALSRRFDCVRTYSVSMGLDRVAAVAKRHGMTVYLGIWLSRTAADNEREMQRGIHIAQAYRDVVRAVIVGNEVLLRGELSQDELADDIRRVGRETGLPVTYADVWEFWLKYPAVGRAVSFVTIHILPYWEDDPVAIDMAVAHVREIYTRMQAAFPDQPLLIGESGWPSRGRQRQGAVASLVNQARFVREFLGWADSQHIRYNLIEAFDQPWKRVLEGTTGGYWGLYDGDLNEKFPLNGPVIENPQWMRGIAAGLAMAVLVALSSLLSGRFSVWRLTVALLAGDALGAVGFAQVEHIIAANRDWREWVLTVTMTLLALVTTWLIALTLGRWASRETCEVIPANWIDLGFPSVTVPSGRLGLLQFAWLFAATVMDLLLLFDARYRDFPTLLFAAPVMAYVCLAFVRERRQRVPPEIEERLMAWFIVAASLLIVLMERPSNLSADLWALLGLAFSSTVLAPTSLRQHGKPLAADVTGKGTQSWSPDSGPE